MQLPDPIQTYFAATDRDTVAKAFAAEAVVHDEAQTHRGPEEIGAWWQASKTKYRHHAEPLDLTDDAGKAVVRARVTGHFPGSPAILTFRFGLTDNRISDLEIG